LFVLYKVVLCKTTGDVFRRAIAVLSVSETQKLRTNELSQKS